MHFIHISDTHIGTGKNFRLYDISTYAAAEKLMQTIQGLPVQPDFVLHTGDVAAVRGEESSYRLAEELFSRLELPIYYVSGNHDISLHMNKMLTFGKKETLISDPAWNAYQFDRQGVRFMVLDAKGPDAIDPHGVVPEEQLRILEKEISESTVPLIVAIHFPALTLDSIWVDRDMLLLNGDTLHRILIKGAHRIRAIFTGHVHRGMQVMQDGILYSTVGSSFLQFFSWPGMEHAGHDQQPVGFFNFVTIKENKTIVKEHVFNL